MNNARKGGNAKNEGLAVRTRSVPSEMRLAILSRGVERGLLGHVMDTLLLYVAPICAGVALFLIYYLPRRLIPATRSSSQNDLITTVASRNEVRKTYAQLFAGASFVVTFMLSIYNFNRDFNYKARQAAADQFIKTSQFLQATNDVQWIHVNAFEIMAMTARDDSSFNPAVFGTMAQFILKYSMLSCEKGADAKAGTKAEGKVDAKADHKANYQMPSELQRIAQIFAGNNVPDPWGKQVSLAGACLSRAQLRDSNGLQLLWLKDARLIGTEFANSNLRGTNIANAKGGINLTDWWTPEIAEQVEAGGYDAVWNLFKNAGQYHWVNFGNAVLDAVEANGARLQGAVFYSASMKNSKWEDANLSFADLVGANLNGAKLNRTIFTGASLRSTSLINADLTEARLEKTNVQEAHFSNTNVTDVDFQSVRGLNGAQIAGMCKTAGGKKPTFPIGEYRDYDVPVC
jgi:uncharacterized protein YjbI with pentapeptide repeats